MLFSLNNIIFVIEIKIIINTKNTQIMNKLLNVTEQIGFGIIIGALAFSALAYVVSNPFIVVPIFIGLFTVFISDIIKLIILNNKRK